MSNLLTDFFDVKNGYAFTSAEQLVDSTANTYEILKQGHIEIGGGLRREPKKSYVVKANKLEKFVLEKGDIVMAMTDMKDNVVILGIPAIIDESNKYVLNQRVAWLKPKPGTLTSFFYYQMLTTEFLEDLRSKANSGVQVNLSILNIKEMSFWVPPLPEQRAIAEVLSSLDDKIDLLHRNNKTLEEMAEVMYLHACNDSQLCNLGDWIEIFDNKRVPLSSIQREKMKSGQLYPYYGAATVMDYVNEYIFDGDYLLVGEDGTVQTEDGYPILQRAVGKSWVNNHTHVLSALKPLNNDLLEVVLRKTNIGHIVTGAVQPKINQASLKSLEILLPTSGIEDLAEQVKLLFDKRLCNRNQIRKLSEIRDNLLPKLMSGQVRVKDI